MKAPIETLFIISEISQRKNILNLLNKNGILDELILNGSGTANSTLGDIFGFGIIEKDVIVSFVDTKISEQICTKLNELINKTTNLGIVFTVPVDAISSDLFDFIGGGKYGKSEKR